VAELLYRTSYLAPVTGREIRGARVLMMVARRGTATHEVMVPLNALLRAGASVVFGSDTAGEVRCDPVCDALAAVERLFTPSPRYRDALCPRTLIAERVASDDLSIFDRFDAVVVPGGHGRVFGDFLKSALVRDVVHSFASSGRLVALECHSVFAGAVAGARGEAPLAHGREVTCWPGAYERVLGVWPFLGRYFKPVGRYVEDVVSPVAAAVHTDALPWRMPHVVVDGNLITSWGPWSAEPFARAIVRAVASAQAHPNALAAHRRDVDRVASFVT
jgi:putative intracellular protease/amidase